MNKNGLSHNIVQAGFPVTSGQSRQQFPSNRFTGSRNNAANKHKFKEIKINRFFKIGSYTQIPLSKPNNGYSYLFTVKTPSEKNDLESHCHARGCLNLLTPAMLIYFGASSPPPC
jgi:hypothetical protein